MKSANLRSIDVKADAIVVAWRSSEIIRRCVGALQEDPAIDQIIVVNNSPEDRLDTSLAGMEGLTLLNPDANLGFGRGVNLARAHVNQSFVVLANPDAVQSDNTVSRLIEFLQCRPSAGIVAPRMVHSDGSLYLNSQYDLSLGRLLGGSIFPRYGLKRTPIEHDTAHLTEYVIASFVVVKTKALDAVDWFDQSIFLFGEDQDLCRRFRQHSWEVWYAPLGRVEHMSGHSWHQDRPRAERLLKESRYRELRKAHGKVSAYAYLMLKAISDQLRKSRKVLTNHQQSSKPSSDPT